MVFLTACSISEINEVNNIIECRAQGFDMSVSDYKASVKRVKGDNGWNVTYIFNAPFCSLADSLYFEIGNADNSFVSRRGQRNKLVLLNALRYNVNSNKFDVSVYIHYGGVDADVLYFWNADLGVFLIRPTYWKGATYFTGSTDGKHDLALKTLVPLVMRDYRMDKSE